MGAHSPPPPHSPRACAHSALLALTPPHQRPPANRRLCPPTPLPAHAPQSPRFPRGGYGGGIIRKAFPALFLGGEPCGGGGWGRKEMREAAWPFPRGGRARPRPFFFFPLPFPRFRRAGLPFSGRLVRCLAFLLFFLLRSRLPLLLRGKSGRAV